MRHWKVVGWLVLGCCWAACGTTQTFVAETQEMARPGPEADVAYRVFLVGDVGAGTPEGARAVMDLLAARLAGAGAQSTVVFLGDQLRGGLADSGAVRRAGDEAQLQRMLAAVRGFPGRVVVLPGEDDWGTAGRGGPAALRRQEHFWEHALGRDDVFLPGDGLPGPVEVALAERLTLVVMDTQWWLTEGPKPFGETGDYDLEEEGDFLLQLEDIIRRNDDGHLLVVGHHPVFSGGPHAGHLPGRVHLFPLTDRWARAYLPLPLLGSAYPLYRRYIGTEQDLASPRYRSLRRALEGLFFRHEHLIYAAGHDGGLQYFDRGHQQYLVSAAGGGAGYVAHGQGAGFSARTPGFFELQYGRDGAVWMVAHVPGDRPGEGRAVFHTQLSGPLPEAVDPGLPAAETVYPDYRDSTRVVAANPRYATGALHRFFFGSQHRDVWAAPVEVPYLDLGREAGGLTPLKRGGGMQTRSLRLIGADGRAYVLRSIDKDPSGTVPKELQGTVADDIVQDGISAIQPYGAFIVPALADAAGVYHTNPRLVYVPDDPRLGVYREAFAGQLMMFEERPDDDMADVPGFGGADEIVSPQKLYEEIDGDNDHRVDQRAFLRARLFDLLLSDWDRHRDQWRWAAFEPHELNPDLDGEARTEGKVYRPIPRDRDWAFNRMNGLFPSLIPYFLVKFQDFSETYGYLQGLTLNGLEQDRRLTNALTRRDWAEVADSLRAALRDEVIAAAVRQWPPAVYAREGATTEARLQARRDRLPAAADHVYRLLAQVVDVVGSHKHERFEVHRQPAGRVEVVVYKTSRAGEVRRVLYRRTFHPEETREVRLYGQGGEDRFVLEGDAGGPILVTVVGGPGGDTFTAAEGAGQGRRRTRTRLYDTAEGNTWAVGQGMQVERSRDPLVNLYDPLAYRHDYWGPLAFFGYNQDDGLFIGGGAQFYRFGFRKEPYARLQRVRANFAARTQAFNVFYEGRFPQLWGRWGLALAADVRAPHDVRNYYGLGNETTDSDGDAEYYQARLTQVRLAPALERPLDRYTTFRLGPVLEFTQVREDPDDFIGQPQAGISPRTFDDQWFAGAEAAVRVQTVDRPVNPRQGFTWTGLADVNLGVEGTSDSYGRLASDLALYLSPSLSPQVTLALRAGGAHNVGAFPFYAANTLGGQHNLRGYRRTRFAGRTSAYQNIELRARLLDIDGYLAIGKAGLLGFLDNGRVWTDGEHSGRWHQGYGGGLWVDLFGQFVVTGTLDRSVEGRSFTLKLGFLY